MRIWSPVEARPKTFWWKASYMKNHGCRYFHLVAVEQEGSIEALCGYVATRRPKSLHWAESPTARCSRCLAVRSC